MPVFVKGGTSILFVHIPKTGGRTIESKFQDSGYQLSYIDMEAEGLNRLRWCSPQHMDSSQYIRILDLSKFAFMFAVVREPVSRLKSELGMHLQQNFRNSVEQNDQWVMDALAGYQANPYLYDNHLRPQYEFIAPGVAVFRFEEGLDAILAEVERRHPDISLVPGHARIGSRAERSGFSSSEIALSEDVTRRIRAFYAADYERYYPDLL
ncbi:MAG: sulfotransferase family protein [Gammaproteobacteria bacterium]|nr:sulfotransferase family protein [Gammaproteobacteria bacterium]